MQLRRKNRLNIIGYENYQWLENKNEVQNLWIASGFTFPHLAHSSPPARNKCVATHQVSIYCMCSFRKVTLVWPPIGPPGTELPVGIERIGVQFGKILYVLLTHKFNKLTIITSKLSLKYCFQKLSPTFCPLMFMEFLSPIITKSWVSLWRQPPSIKTIGTSSQGECISVC